MMNRNSSRSVWTVRLLASTALALVLPSMADANPADGQVSAGTATILQTNPKTLTINQTTQKAIINWQSFSIGQGETTTFRQPGASAITLNRVTGGDPSSILGNLTANGQVWLINPNGIAFGKTARVDVAGLLATTIDINDRDFMSGNYRFSGLKNPSAMVTNAGQITVRNAGLASLVAPGVENSGLIQANLGQIQLSSAAAFTVDLYGDGLFNFTLDKQVTQAIKKPDGSKPSAAVSNSGQLIANGGKVFLTANAAKSVVDHSINMDGYIQATNATVSSTGEITLDGGSEGTVHVAGTIDASGKGAGQTGGTVHVTGQDVRLATTVNIDASGDTRGGTVLVGGEMHGGGTLRHAATTTVAQGATIKADAVNTGSGGIVVVWSDDLTNFTGTISALGGRQGGSGGSAEVSSHRQLNYQGVVDLRAINGSAGTLLLDPENVTISSSGDTPALPGTASSPILLNPTADSSVLSVATLQKALTLADVTVTTGSTGSQSGDIFVAASIAWNGSSSLTLSAYRNIAINDGVTIANVGSGNLSLRADSQGVGIGTATFNGTGKVDFSQSTGLVALFYNPSDNPAGSLINTASYTHPTNYSSSISLSSPAQFAAYMLVNSVYDLQNVENNLAGTYALGKDIDASSTAGWSWAGGIGFAPLGHNYYLVNPFVGVFNGSGHTILNLTINSTASGTNTSSEIGLFGGIGVNGIVENLGLANVSIKRTSTFEVNANRIGAIAGTNGGTITRSWVSGAIFSDGNAGQTLPQNVAIGGIAGVNNGAITESYSIARVESDTNYGAVLAGGLAGSNSGTITNSYTAPSGAVYAAHYYTASLGGLTGSNSGNIGHSYAAVTIGDGGAANNSVAYRGGLVGANSGPITYSYWDTSVSGLGTATGSSSAGVDVQALGETTEQLQAAHPSWLDPQYWPITNSGGNPGGGYPVLLWQLAQVAPLQINFGIGTPGTTTITWKVADVSSTYGTLANLGAVTLAGVASSDTGKVSGTVGLFSGNTQVALSPSLAAGTYSEEVVSLSGSAANNYTLASSGNTFGTLTINPKALTWTVSDASFVYGTTPSIGSATLSGILGSDAVSGTVGVFNGATTIAVTSSTPVGTYAEKVTGLTGAAASNYTLATSGNIPGTLTISPALLTALTWKVADASSTYGTLASLGAVTLTGVTSADSGSVSGTVGLFLNSNGTSSVTLSPSLNAGKYYEGVTALTGTAAGNYTLSSGTFGILTINPAQLSVVVNNASRVYGDPNPAFTATITGFKLNDDASVFSGLTFATTATSASGVNQYAITSSGATATNYVITSRKDGVLTITPKTLTWTIADATSTYGTAPALDNVISLIGVINSDDAKGVVGLRNKVADFDPSSPIIPPGIYTEYALRLSGTSAKNYLLALSGATGTLTVRSNSAIGQVQAQLMPISPSPIKVAVTPGSGFTFAAPDVRIGGFTFTAIGQLDASSYENYSTNNANFQNRGVNCAAAVYVMIANGIFGTTDKIDQYIGTDGNATQKSKDGAHDISPYISGKAVVLSDLSSFPAIIRGAESNGTDHVLLAVGKDSRGLVAFDPAVGTVVIIDPTYGTIRQIYDPASSRWINIGWGGATDPTQPQQHTTSSVITLDGVPYNSTNQRASKPPSPLDYLGSEPSSGVPAYTILTTFQARNAIIVTLPKAAAYQ